MLKFAANLTMMFNEVPFLKRFEVASKAGFRYVEFLWPYEYPASLIKQKLTDFNLKLVLFNTSAGDINNGEWGLTALPNREDDAQRAIDLALQYAIELNCPNVHIMAGVVPEGKAIEIYQQVFIQNLRQAAAKFKPHNINILIEALSPQVKPNYLLKSQFDSLSILEQVDCENVFIQLDYFHAQNVDGKLSELTDLFKGKIGHIQIASVPERHEPDEGEVNYQYLFNKLQQINYQGYIGCEYKPRASTEQGLAWFKAYR